MLAAAVLVVFAGSAAAQATNLQFAPLGKRHLPLDQDSTIAMAWGDVDGDGDLDLVTGNRGNVPGEQNRLYLNDGNGVFDDVTAARMPAVADLTYSVALGDVDGDGDLDIVLGNSGQNRLCLNDGSGTFTDVTASQMPAVSDWTRSVVLGDVDGDGDLDIVSGSSTRENRLYLNNGTGTFTDATAGRLPVLNDVTNSVALGDVDGDGDLDIVVGSATRETFLYLNNGTGIFTDVTAARLPVQAFVTNSVALGDVDGDGDLDIVFGNGDYAGGVGGQTDRLYLNDGSGTFTDATFGRLPLVSEFTAAVVLGDLDGDGDLDLVLGNRGSPPGLRNRLLLNNGAGVFTDYSATRLPAIVDWTSSVLLGDVDGDGDLDVAIGNTGLQNRLYLNDGSATFGDVTVAPLPAISDRTTSQALGDVDGDGDLDLVVGNYGTQNRLYANDANGTFLDVSAGRMPPYSGFTSSVTLGDVDGDGDLDIVFGGHNKLYLNDGSGTFTDVTAARLPAIRESTRSVVLGDVDGDGDLDLVVGNYGLAFSYGQQNRLYINDGGGTFTDVTASRMPVISDFTTSVALGDVDGDGDLDLIIGNGGVDPANQQNRLWRNDGSGTFTDVTASQMPVVSDRTRSVVLGDVDGDGDLDLVVGRNAQQTGLHVNDGRGTFTDVTASQMPPISTFTTSVALGDVDVDGAPDLVVGHGYGIRLFRNDGSGTFTDVTAARMAQYRYPTESVVLGDIDLDGDPDLFVGNGNRGNLNFLHVNLHHHLHVPYALRPGRPLVIEAYACNTAANAPAVAFPFLSLSRISLTLPPYGTVGITPDVSLGFAVIPQASGVVPFVRIVPNLPALVGLRVYAQALILSARGGGLTNVTGDVMIR